MARHEGHGMLGRKANGCRAILAVIAVGFAGQGLEARETPRRVADAVEHVAVDGAGLGEWTARWWQWAFAQPITPYLDRDGSACAQGQDGPVWFLAGTNGRFTAKRTCAIPLDKHVLVPVINMIHYARADEPDTPCADLQAGAAVNNDHLASAVVMLDGVVVEGIAQRRVRSNGCFRIEAGDAQSPLAASDGYWIMLKPLPRGRHTLSIGANYANPGEPYGGMHQNFEYVLDVGGPTVLSGTPVVVPTRR